MAAALESEMSAGSGPNPSWGYGYGWHRGPSLWWILPVVLGVAIVAFWVVIGFATGPHPAPGVYYFWPFFPFGFFVILFLVFAVVRWGSWGWGHRWHGGGYAPPREILRMRYARGEITLEQYRQMDQELRNSRL